MTKNQLIEAIKDFPGDTIVNIDTVSIPKLTYCGEPNPERKQGSGMGLLGEVTGVYCNNLGIGLQCHDPRYIL